MELNQLRCFSAVARVESMTAAAKELGISQPALSGVIRRLEEEIGIRLFDRSGGRLRLSPAGRAFYGYVNDALATLDLGVRVMGKEAENQQIVVYNRLTSNMAPNLYVQRVQADFPNRTFRYFQAESGEDAPCTEAASASILITEQPQMGNYVYLASYAERWCVMFNRKYRFAGGAPAEALTLSQISVEPIAFYGSEADARFVRETFAQAGLECNLTLVPSAVESGGLINRCRAIGLVPQFNFWSICSMIENMPNIALPIAGTDFSRTIYLARHKLFGTLPEEQRILQVLDDYLRTEMDRKL